MSAPELSNNDVEQAAKDLYGVVRRHDLLAFYGTGQKGNVRIGDAGPGVPVIPVDSELRLRERLLELAPSTRAIFLVPWHGSLPLDVAGRFAKAGRILRVGREARIRTLFGAAKSEPPVRDSVLAAYLLKHHTTDRFSVAGGNLTVDAMWSAWLERAWGLPKGEVALDCLLGFAAVDGHGPSFVATLEQRDAAQLREALLEHLDNRLGQCGSLVWKAWELGNGRQLLYLAILSSALNDSTDASVGIGLKMLATQLGGEHAADGGALSRLAAAADPALRFVKQHAGPKEVRKLLREADDRVTLVELRPHLRSSNVLPSAWQGRLDELGLALTEVARQPTPDNLWAAVAGFGRLDAHALYAETEHARVIHRAQMAVRLAGWLSSREQIAPSVSSYGDVEVLANWFAADGGYVDWARKAARGVSESGFDQGVVAILDKVDTIRQELDRRFARALPAWLEARRPTQQVFPIDQGIKRVASAFLAGNDDRRLLVLLMDGMAWAQAVEILDSLGHQAAVWGPLAWHGVKKHRTGSGHYPAMLANFPTTTQVSRSAFFAGKSMQVGKTLSSTKDPDKWQKNREALKYCDDNVLPLLLLKGDGHTKDGSASEEALSLVADTRRRMVGIVINTIDMALKSDAAQRHEWRVDNIKSLKDLLDKARDVGRAVMLVSDHGHVPADRFGQSAGKMKGGARWREWKKGEGSPAEFEVALPAGDGVWAPRGADGVVLIADDAHRYGGGPCAGEHGGAALAEVVAPCLLIGSEDSPAVADDAAQSVSPAVVPSWWHFNVGRRLAQGTTAADAPPLTASARRKARKPPKNQLSLPQMKVPKVEELPVEAAVVPAPVVTPASSAFATCEMLKTRATNAADLQKVVKAVEFLLANNGIADGAAFAQAVGIFAKRARGHVSWLQEILNVDGYQVIRFDPGSQQVRLEIPILSQQFEVEL